MNKVKQSIIYSLLLILLIGCCKKTPTNSTPIINQESPRYIDLEASWSPDGSTIAYIHNDLAAPPIGVYFINPDGTNKRMFLQSIEFQKLWHQPDWSPDGKWLVLSEGYSAQLYRVRAPNCDSLTQLTTYGSNYFPAWSINGKIAWSIPSGDSIMGLWIMNSDTTNKKRLYPYGSMPDWNPNGDKLAYIGPSAEGSSTATEQVWIMDTLGNNKYRITNFNILNRYPKVSPNGSEIVFTSAAEGQGPRIWVVNLNGLTLRQLTQTGGDRAAWSPDGSKIVYTNTVDGKLWVMDSSGTNKKQLTN